ncbi:MAG: hypothetical protein ACOH13_05900 [Flavobacteriales bacterium]
MNTQLLRAVLLSMATACCWSVSAQSLHAPAPEPANFSLLDPPRQAPPSLQAEFASPWEYNKLGTFCKLDVQLERRLKIPVLFRLGDPLQVDALEGKGPLWSAENRP